MKPVFQSNGGDYKQADHQQGELRSMYDSNVVKGIFGRVQHALFAPFPAWCYIVDLRRGIKNKFQEGSNQHQGKQAKKSAYPTKNKIKPKVFPVPSG
jgi:hypothetical protein